jgi:hypothetical protein
MKQFFDKLKRYWAYVLGIAGFIGHITLVFGYLSSSFAWGNQWVFSYIRSNYLIIWLISLTLFMIAGIYWINLINRRFLIGFTDNFKKSLNLNWDYIGPWKIADENTLLVTGSDEGGITKQGADWENYSLSFRAKILNGRIGVVIRASDLNNYYMLQINPKAIVPHYRISYPKIKNTSIDPLKGLEIEMQTGWQIFSNSVINLNRELNDWFDVRIKVKGQSVSMFIDNNLAFHEDSFLQISKGKIGFRCAGEERGLIKNVKVRLNI